MGRIIPYIMEKQNVPNHQPDFIRPKNISPRDLLSYWGRINASVWFPLKLHPPFQTCSWMAFFSKTAETQTLLHGPRISNLHGTWRMIPLGNWTQVPEVGCPIYKWVIKSGWWFQPLWKIWKSVGIVIPNWMESHKSHVPNHQPVVITILSSTC